LDIFKKHYSKKGIWLIFSTSAVPIHVWTFILFFRDFSWISERTNSWDALGVGSYGLLIALLESAAITIAAIILGFIISKKWVENHRVALLGMLVFISALWAIIGQLYFLMDFSVPNRWLRVIARYPHPLWILYGACIVVIGTSVLLPSYFIVREGKFSTSIYKIIESLSPLTTLYLFLDLIGLIIIVIRNV